MNTLLTLVSSLFLLSIALPKCSSMSIPERNDDEIASNIYLFTEDAQPGRFDKLPLEQTPQCRNEFLIKSSSVARHYIIVGRYTGILALGESLLSLRDSLPADTYGIRKVTVALVILRRCAQVTQLYYPSTTIVSRKVLTIKFTIFPVNFGDQLLRDYTPEIISAKVHESDTFQNTNSPSSLLRILRAVSQKMDRKAFDKMISSVKVKKALEIVINEILTKYVTTTAGEQVFYRWYLNSLFSKDALEKLANDCGCKEDEVQDCPKDAEYRTINGTCNNIKYPLFGSAPNALNRAAGAEARYYDVDGLNDPIGFPGQTDVPDIPSTFKVVREFIIQQDHPASSDSDQHSHALMQFGQFLDHDLDLSPESQSSDNCQHVKCDGSSSDFAEPCYTILGLPEDPRFKCTRFARSASECQIKSGRITTREQINVNTAYIDGSQIYGSTDKLANELRDLTNNKGLMRTVLGVNGDFMPPDDRELMEPNSFCQESGGCYLAGDSRSSEQMVLATTHTLFVREHNRIARVLGNVNPNWDGEKIYQEARKIVGAVLQKITFEDFLPLIIGKNALPEYTDYDPEVNPDVLNSFSTAAYRFGHSLIRPSFDRLDKHFNPTGAPIQLRHLFFNNTYIRDNGIDEVILGLLSNASQKVDRELAAGILNHLFERPKSPGMSLAALNIQRGRDHGLPGYNTYRRFCGLSNAKTFADTKYEITNGDNRILLGNLYKNNPELADLWVAGLAETPANGGVVGATFQCIISEQMRRARDGDSFFYTRAGVFPSQQLEEIRKATLSKIICDNLKNIVSIQKNAFFAGSSGVSRIECGNIPGIDLTAWKEPTAAPPPYY